jgi:hypothetical protein
MGAGVPKEPLIQEQAFLKNSSYRSGVPKEQLVWEWGILKNSSFESGRS